MWLSLVPTTNCNDAKCHHYIHEFQTSDAIPKRQAGRDWHGNATQVLLFTPHRHSLLQSALHHYLLNWLHKHNFYDSMNKCGKVILNGTERMVLKNNKFWDRADFPVLVSFQMH